MADHFPDYQLDHERERRLQILAVARALGDLVIGSAGPVIIAGYMDADAGADSIRFLTGRHVIDDTSVCCRDAWEAAYPQEPLITYSPSNLYQTDHHWPFRGIDHVMVRCAATGPTLLSPPARGAFDLGPDTISDHYGLVVDYTPAPPAGPAGGNGDGADAPKRVLWALPGALVGQVREAVPDGLRVDEPQRSLAAGLAEQVLTGAEHDREDGQPQPVDQIRAP